MTAKATAKLKCRPAKGNLPALQYLLPQQLAIDPDYQRSIEAADSQALIRRIAQHWDWDLCQPLVVSRRENGDLFVIDGQHRLAAARLRGDIAQLPAVVVSYADSAAEAASFVALNQKRRPLKKLDIFKAAVAANDPEACAILQAIEDAGLSVAPHQNYVSWKPGMIANIGGIEAAWRKHGSVVTRAALRALRQGFGDQVLQYAGSLFPGIVAVCAAELSGEGSFDDTTWALLVEMIGGASQSDWRRDIARLRAEDPSLRYSAASEKVFADAWGELLDAFFEEEAEVAAEAVA